VVSSPTPRKRFTHAQVSGPQVRSLTYPSRVIGRQRSRRGLLSSGVYVTLLLHRHPTTSLNLRLMMAPSTHLRDQPERRVEYREVTRVGTCANPIELDDDTPPPATQRTARTTQTARKSTANAPPRAAAAPRSRAGRALLPARQSLSPTITRVDTGAVVKPKAPIKKAVKAPAKEKKLPSPKRECSVCISTKNVSHSFRLDKNEEACEHFKSICSQCVTKMIAGKIESRQLSEAELACPYPDCDHVLDHTDLKMAFTNKEKFKEQDSQLHKV
jgi:hypothetical protein